MPIDVDKDKSAVVLTTIATTAGERVRAYLRRACTLRFALLMFLPPALLPLAALALQPPAGSPLLRYAVVFAVMLAATLFLVGLLGAAITHTPQRTLVLSMDGIEERNGASVVQHGWDWVTSARATVGLLRLTVRPPAAKSLRMSAPALTRLDVEERAVGPVMFARLLALLTVKGHLSALDLDS